MPLSVVAQVPLSGNIAMRAHEMTASTSPFQILYSMGQRPRSFLSPPKQCRDTAGTAYILLPVDSSGSLGGHASVSQALSSSLPCPWLLPFTGPATPLPPLANPKGCSWLPPPQESDSLPAPLLCPLNPDLRAGGDMDTALQGKLRSKLTGETAARDSSRLLVMCWMADPGSFPTPDLPGSSHPTPGTALLFEASGRSQSTPAPFHMHPRNTRRCQPAVTDAGTLPEPDVRQGTVARGGTGVTHTRSSPARHTACDTTKPPELQFLLSQVPP